MRSLSHRRARRTTAVVSTHIVVKLVEKAPLDVISVEEPFGVLPAVVVERTFLADTHEASAMFIVSPSTVTACRVKIVLEA